MTSAEIMNSVFEKAVKAGKRIVLPEGGDGRVAEAAARAAEMGIAKIILLNKSDIDKHPKKEEYIKLLYELRKEKGITEDEARRLASDPFYFGALMIKNGDADGMVGGATAPTGDLLRPALQLIKCKPGIKSVSSCFMMLLPEGSKYGENGVIFMGDCAVIPNPDAEQLADIAAATADSAAKLGGFEPKVAMLSFSTKGSAKHELSDKVIAATEIVKQKCPGLNVDGELQADAAIVESVARLKAPGSKVAGRANVLIFPDLQAANIGYKLVQRFGGAEAVGPICQGFNKPVNDLSRGCNAEEIIKTIAITAVLDN